MRSRLTSKEHFNLPNFDTLDQLAYPEFENEERKIPDLTIGLRSYDLAEWSRSEDIEVLRNDRVRMFDQNLLERLEIEDDLTPPFIRTGSSGVRVRDSAITFPFGFWEAKRKGGGYDHQSAQKQNALKVKMILSWQDQVAKRADVPWSPLAWYFVSVGSLWEVYGCHFEQNSIAKEGRICVSRSSPPSMVFAETMIFRCLKHSGLAIPQIRTTLCSFCILLTSLHSGVSTSTNRLPVHASVV